MLTNQQDACGNLIMAHWRGINCKEIIERDDGWIEVSSGPQFYFTTPEGPEDTSRAMSLIKGRVLDIGSGAGRHSLYLQERGHEVVAIDNSPLAIQVCRERGVKDARVMSVTEVGQFRRYPPAGDGENQKTFDTIIMFGANLALLENKSRAKWLLKRFHQITSPDGIIIGQTRDPHRTDLKENLDYHARNIARGRLPGQVRIRVRYRKFCTPWFDYLFTSESELRELIVGTGWDIRETIWREDGVYYAVMGKV